MAMCGECGAELRHGDRFCTQCAAPVPGRLPGRPHLPAVLAVAVVAVLLTTVAATAWYSSDGRADPAPGPSAAPGPVSAAAPAGDPPPADAGLVRPPADPTEELAAHVVADRPAAEALVDTWSPQISSKAEGLAVNGVVYDASRILAEFRAARQRYGAILVRSDDFSTFRKAGYWVVLVPPGFTSPEAANSWCLTNGFAPDDCFAKRLSHVDGPEGNTLFWRR